MATTLLIHSESFLYTGDQPIFYLLDWYTGVEEMDRFYPSSKQQEHWSRNYKKPFQQPGYNNRGSPNTPNTTASPSKVTSTSSRGRTHREGSHTETSYSQGITLRPEDLLMGNGGRLSISPSSGYDRSNPVTPGTRPKDSPGAYLFPNVEVPNYGNRRSTIGGSATELHVPTTENQPMIRRASDGNYNRYETGQEPDIRFLKYPRNPSPQQQYGKNNRKPPHVPQDSVDTSDSSISSLPGNGSTTSTTTNDVTSGSHGDAETSYSSTSSTSYSGADDDPTSTSSPVSSSSSSPSTVSYKNNAGTNSPKSPHVTSESTCPYCRLHNSSSDSGDYCHKRSCSISSCCSSINEKLKTSTIPPSKEKTITDTFARNPRKSEQAPLNLLSTPSKSLNSLRKDDDDHDGSQAFGDLKQSRLKSDTSPHINLTGSIPPNVAPSTTSPVKYRRLARRAPKPPTSFNFGTKLPTVPRTLDNRNQELPYLDDSNVNPSKESTTFMSPAAFRHKSSASFRDNEYGSTILKPKYDIIRKSRTKSKANVLDEDKINLKVYSPNVISYHRISHLNNRTPSPYSTKENYNRRVINKRHESYPGNINYTILGADSLENRRVPRYQQKFRSVDDMDDDDIPKGNRRIGYRRSLSHIDLNNKAQARNSASSPTDTSSISKGIEQAHKPSPTKKSHKTKLPLSTLTKPKIALAQDTSNDFSDVKVSIGDPTVKSKRHQDNRHKECKRASKILHTKVTLVKREPSDTIKFQLNNQEQKSTNFLPTTNKVSDVSSKDSNGLSTENSFTSLYTDSLQEEKLPSQTIETTITIEEPSAPEDTGSAGKKHGSAVIEISNEGDSKSKHLLTVTPHNDDTSSSIDTSMFDKSFNSPEDDSIRIDVDSSEMLKSENSGKSLSFSFSTSTNADTKSKSDSTLGTDIAGSAETLKNTKSPEDDEFSSSPCLCGSCAMLSKDTETSEKTENVISEEECSMCQKEKRRALSPEVLVLTAAVSKEDEDVDAVKKDIKKKKNKLKPLEHIKSSDLATTTGSEESLTIFVASSEKPPKSPEYLTAEFDFEPEIIHKANPSVDDAVDEKVLRHSDAFRRLSEEEFIATLNIHDAARKGDLHVVKLLVKKDPKQMETVDERGWTPIHLAAAHGHTEIVKYLSQEGAHMAALDPSSYTAMHLAAMNGFNQCVEILLQMGVDVDCVTAEGFTPLHLAAMNAHLECCQTVLHWGASLDKRDALGRTVYDMVEEYGLDDVSHLICRFKRQLKKFQEMFQMIQPALGDNGGGSFIASLSRLNESNLPKEVLDILAEFSEESGLE